MTKYTSFCLRPHTLTFTRKHTNSQSHRSTYTAIEIDTSYLLQASCWWPGCSNVRLPDTLQPVRTRQSTKYNYNHLWGTMTSTRDIMDWQVQFIKIDMWFSGAWSQGLLSYRVHGSNHEATTNTVKMTKIIPVHHFTVMSSVIFTVWVAAS